MSSLRTNGVGSASLDRLAPRRVPPGDWLRFDEPELRREFLAEVRDHNPWT